MGVLDALLMNTATSAPVSVATEKKSERIITVDDSGWGYPILGVVSTNILPGLSYQV